YSLGACAYALLTGRPPFEGANEYDVIYKQLNDDPAPPSEVAPVAAGVPKWLDRVILEALRKDPDARYGSVRELGEALREAKQAAEQGGAAAALAVTPGRNVTSGSRPVKVVARRVSPVVWVAVLAILAVIGGVGYTLLVK